MIIKVIKAIKLMTRKILIVAAHPDDEVLGCAGVSAKNVMAGDEVHVLFMTNGVDARNEDSAKELERQTATQKALDIVGISSVKKLNLPDNKMDSIPLLEIIRLIEETIKKINPSVIYTHHIGDLNIDHRITHQAVMTACRPQPKFCVKEIYAFEVLSSTEWQTSNYNQFLPNVFVDITNYVHIKKDALMAYNDEMRQPPHSRSVDNVLRLSNFRGNSVGCNYAEAFMLLRKID